MLRFFYDIFAVDFRRKIHRCKEIFENENFRNYNTPSVFNIYSP